MGESYQLLTRTHANRTNVALLDQENRLIEFHQENAASIIGSILIGRVERVLPDVRAAFVRIGQPLNGFLPLKEAESYHQTMGSAPLMSGQEIIVQVKKDPKGGKGAFLTRDISLPGQNMLLMPCNRFVGVSKRIECEADRRSAQALGEEVAQNRFGVIIRHAALYAQPEEVGEEAEKLWQLWQDISQNSAHIKAPAVLHKEPSIQDVLIRDYSARHELMLSEDEGKWQSLQIDRQVRQALNRRVELSDGGSLVIDEREALQTIDVNSGRMVKAEKGQSLAFEENLNAVPEIARQIRLRNLSGMILIDFIDMESDKERFEILEAMQEATKDDRIKNVIHGFTRLGLLEMTRKRTSDSLKDTLAVPCAACRGSGITLEV